MAVDASTTHTHDLERALRDGLPVRVGNNAVGRASVVYYDSVSGEPRWLGIADGAPGTLVVPAASVHVANDDVRVAEPPRLVQTAPRVTGESIAAPVELEIARHYGLVGQASPAARPQQQQQQRRPQPVRDEPHAPQAPLWRETKPFFLTSEFLLTVLGIAGMFITTAVTEDSLFHQRAWTLSTVLAAAYIASRGIAKAASREFEARRRLGEPGYETKPSWLTSELFVLVVGLVAIFLTTWTDGDALTRERAWLLATILGATYVISRGIAKAGVRYLDDRDADLPMYRDPRAHR